MDTELKKQKIKRRQYLIEKKFQLKYVGLILALMFATAALCSYVVYYTSMLSMGEKLAGVYPQGRLMHIVKMVNFRILMSLILVTPLIAIIGVFLSHKIAGPLYRIERFLGGMASGDLASRIVLRQGDELMGLADKINNLGDNLKAAVSDQKARLNKVLASLDRLKNANPSNNDIINTDNEIKALYKDLEKYKL